MTTKQERLCEVYTYLRGKGKVHTQADFAEMLRITRPAISAAMNGNEAYLTKNLFQKICGAFPGVFNLDYLLTGEGELLLPKDTKQSNPRQSESVRPDIDLYKQLLEARDESNRDLRALNERLQAMVEDRDSTITELNERIEDMTQQLTDAVAHVDHYKQLVAEREHEVERLKVQMDDIRIAQVEKQNYLEKLNGIIDDKNKTISDRDTTLLDLRAIITTLKTEIKAYQEDPFHRYPHPIGVADEGDKIPIKQPNVSPNEK